MNTYVAYDKDSFQILAFIKNNYTNIEETKEIFKNFENCTISRTSLEIPTIFSDYKVIIKNDEIVNFEKL